MTANATGTEFPGIAAQTADLMPTAPAQSPFHRHAQKSEEAYP
jgi:hypothetical protein